jgi:hypothetical protein
VSEGAGTSASYLKLNLTAGTVDKPVGGCGGGSKTEPPQAVVIKAAATINVEKRREEIIF